ncbi:hypothetical protein [Bradyrhizobium murdochi]|uniref:hypothetical protein n=1 Tax=Bradyrhizobium murdochi TaxID=1038859 RepID=UPI0012ECB513|nr:hypothetical protein [Bradyrhizobium murdochi]
MLIEETTHIVYTIIEPPAFAMDIQLVRDFIFRFVKEIKHQSVAVELLGKVYFISDFEPKPPKLSVVA